MSTGSPLQAWDTTILDGTTVRWWFDYYAPPPAGIVVTLRFAGRAVGAAARPSTSATASRRNSPGSTTARPPGMLPGRIGDGTLVETDACATAAQ